jgi:hypothetical protein
MSVRVRVCLRVGRGGSSLCIVYVYVIHTYMHTCIHTYGYTYIFMCPYIQGSDLRQLDQGLHNLERSLVSLESEVFLFFCTTLNAPSCHSRAKCVWSLGLVLVGVFCLEYWTF